MDRLWTDGPQTRTYAPPTHPRPPIAEPPFTAPPAASPPPLPPAAGGGGGRSPWLAAVGGGTVSALLVTAVLFGTGIAGGDDQQQQVPAGTTTPPAVVNASDAKGDLVRTVYAAASPSVVSVLTQSGSGTGFLADGNGTIVTNAHVVGDASQVKVRFEDGGELHDAEVLGVDESVDLAALKVDADAAKGVRPLRFADSDSVQVGDSAVAIGYPLGLDRTATAGIVSGLERKIDSPNGFSIDKVIQTDAPINPGNSGGPLLDSNAQVIGVNSQIATAGGEPGQRRHRLRDPGQHRQGGAPAARARRDAGARLPRPLDERGAERRRADRRRDSRRPGREGGPHPGRRGHEGRRPGRPDALTTWRRRSRTTSPATRWT